MIHPHPEALFPSTTNPRKSFDQDALAELIESVRMQSVQTPLVVRPHPASTHITGPGPAYEIVAGERRWRAAKAAGVEELPCILIELDDEQALNMQMLENLHRSDLHPLEEAMGYKALLEQPGTSLENAGDVARLIGKTEAHVAQRMKLLALEPTPRQMFLDGRIELGHALILARLTPKDQDRATREFLLGSAGQPKKVTTASIYAERAINYAGRAMNGRRMIQATVADLREWAQRNVMLALDRAPWGLDDARLVPEAGACTACPKRSGSNVALFADLTAAEDICLDPACFATKRTAYVTLQTQKAIDAGKILRRLSNRSSHAKLPDLPGTTWVYRKGQWVNSKKGSCPDTVRGIAVDDESNRYRTDVFSPIKAGDVLYVCANQRCKVHKHLVDKPQGAEEGTPARANRDREKAEEAARAEAPIRAAVFNAARQMVTPEARLERMVPADNFGGETALAVLEAMKQPIPKRESRWDYTKVNRAAEAFIMICSEEQLAYTAFLQLAIPELEPSGWNCASGPDGLRKDRERLWAIARACGVDPDRVVEGLQAAKVPEEPEKAVSATTAKRAARKEATAKKAVANGRKLPVKKGGA